MSQADDLDPTASLGDWLAFDVRRYRQAADMTQRQLARELRVSYQQMCHLEANRRNFTREQVRALDVLWDTGGHFERLWIHAQREHDAEWFRKYTAYERRSDGLNIFEPLIIPGMFQTIEYARALLRGGRVADIEAAIAARMERQENLTKDDPPEVLAIVDEKALHQPVGGLEVMRGQLHRLLEITAMPHVTLQVVPKRAGAYVGLDGGFTLLSIGEEGELGYSEAQLGGRLIRDEQEVRTLTVMYGGIRAKAMSEDDSLTYIQSILEAMK